MTNKGIASTLKGVGAPLTKVLQVIFSRFMRESGCRSSIAFLFALLLMAGSVVAEVGIVQTSSAHLRIVYEAAGSNWRMDTGRSVLVGLPLEGEVGLQIIEAQVAEQLEAEEVLDEVGEDLRLDGPAFLGQPGFVRDQRVVQLVFAPRREAEGRILVYNRVVVELHFTGGLSSGGRWGQDKWGEEFYRRTLLNYEQARKWRRFRSRFAPKAGLQSAATSLLKVVVPRQGMYRISGRDLEAAGLSLEEVDPARLRVLYGGGGILSLSPAQGGVEREEIASVIEDGGDGRFAVDDFILFYGEPVSRWEYNREESQYQYLNNPYTGDNVYWLEIGGEEPGKRAAVRSGALQDSKPQVPQNYRVKIHAESEDFIRTQTFGIKSGYEWYWHEFRRNARNFSNVIQNAIDTPVNIRLHFFAVKTDAGKFPLSQFDVRWNDKLINQISFEGVPRFATELEASEGAQEGTNQLGLFHNGHVARLDWYELEYSREFVAKRGELIFGSPVFEGIAEFRLTGFAEERPRIFEFSEDLVEIKAFEYDATAGTVVFQDSPGEIPRQYLVAGPARWKRPDRIELYHPGALRTLGNGADYLIVTHQDFASAAQRLAAWREQDDRFGAPLQTMVVDVQDIYDEFSGGLLDPAGIRNFLAYAVENWSPRPFFVVLFGDGSYDYKNNSGTSPGNWIPPYQDGDSTYDEWYVRVIGEDELPDLAIGRLTVQTAQEADIVADKLIDYDRQPQVGPWQSRVLLVADDLSNPKYRDRLETFFLNDAEFLAATFLPRGLDLVKHYIAQFPLEGREKPRARDEYIRLFNEGALILTYIGHGNPEVLAHEQMFVLSRDFPVLDNGRRLHFMYTAASQTGVFDDPVRNSMPETMLKMPNGGVIGMISATRVGYHTSNMVLAYSFHRQMYRSGREHVPVGTALMEAKQLSHSSVSIRGRKNIRRYSLIGDPATRLARPRYQAVLQVADTLRALQEIHIQGQVLRPDGTPANDYNGQARVQAFDSSVLSKLDGLNYQRVGGPLFRGIFPVENGRFTAAFRVPKDITYRGTNGRVSAYLWSADQPAGFGSVEGLQLAGTAEGVEPDQQGPEIIIGFAGREQVENGQFVPQRPLLRATIRDESGINVTGETGHEIVLTVDETIFKVTDGFTSAGGNYREGLLEYQLPALEPGAHVVGLKAWDTFNNSAQTQVEIQVGEAGDVALADVLFYPNPLQGEEGHFTYNLSAPARSVQIQVFSLGGKLVDELEGTTQSGYNQAAWQPAVALANGTYLYRIQVRSEEDGVAEQTAAIQVMK